MASSMDLETLTVHGTLVWDTTQDGLVLRTGYLLVEQGGLFQLGRDVSPMRLGATVHITKGPHEHPKLGYRFMGTHGRGSRITVHGRPLGRTWTLLGRDAKPGATQLFLKHDPVEMGWQAGDRIGLATTSRGRSTQHRIHFIAPATEWGLPIDSLSAGKGNETAAMAIDGDVETVWWTWWTKRSLAHQHWLRLNLNRGSHVTRIRVNFHPNRYAPHYMVQVLHDPAANWSTVQNVTDGRGGWRDLPVFRDAVALRIYAPDYDALKLRELDAEPAWAGLWLREVEVFGRQLDTQAPTVLHLTDPVTDLHWGGWKAIHGHQFEMAAEVVNLERSVLITGDHEDFYTSKQGFHVMMHGQGIMDMRYTRAEYCGQRDSMGRYCLHFHLGGQCPECIFQGNAVVDSQQVGITIHGTHRSLVDNNVVWDARGVGIYIEDGNEMHNIMRHNVVICSHWTICSVPWLLHAAYAGIYIVAMTNDMIGNRIAGYENGIWTPGATWPGGQGVASHRVCPQFMPYGTIRGNVNHDNQRFGLYVDNQHPRRLSRDVNGYVTDGCGAFTNEGNDNGLAPANVIEDEFDWHNMFVGQYSSGDISYVRYTSVNNGHAMYWKRSKNFADGVSHHMRDSVFANHPSLGYGALQLLGPSGPFTFLLTNTTFVGGPVGCAAVCAGQHCGLGGAGGPCDVQYLLQAVNFSGLDPGTKRIKFGIHTHHGPAMVLPVFNSPPGDDSLGGFRSVVSQHLTGFGSIPGCTKTGWTWDMGFGCSAAVRRLNLWSTNMSIVQIIGPGYEASPNWEWPTSGMNSGMMPYQPTPGTTNGGYGTPVIAGANYSLVGDWRGDVIPEFSDPAASRLFAGDEFVNLSFEVGGDRSCTLRPTDSRQFVGAYGPAQGMPPPHHCVIGKPRVTTTTTTTSTTTRTGTHSDSHTTSQPGPTTCPGRIDGMCEFANSPGVDYYWDVCCLLGQLGCRADGLHDECRFCGAGPWATVPCPSTTTTTTLEGASHFQKLSRGACVDIGLSPIKTQAACEGAARALSLRDVAASVLHHPDRPEGCYYFQGSQLWLNTDQAAAGKGAETSTPEQQRHPICAVPHIQVLSSGSCSDIGWFPITQVNACEMAAGFLNLPDTTASVTDTTAPRPEGCYFFMNQYLWLSTDPSNQGRGAETSTADASRFPLCTTSEPPALLSLDQAGLQEWAAGGGGGRPRTVALSS